MPTLLDTEQITRSVHQISWITANLDIFSIKDEKSINFIFNIKLLSFLFKDGFIFYFDLRASILATFSLWGGGGGGGRLGQSRESGQLTDLWGGVTGLSKVKHFQISRGWHL